MSRIYDALIKAEKKRRHSRIAFSRRWRNDKARPLSLSWQDISLEWKIMGTIASVMLVFGLLLVAIVNQLMGRALRTQIDQRALVIATNLSDGATGHVVSKDVLQLNALVTKYARLSGVAYAFIKDREGKVIAHSLGAFSPELEEVLTFDQRRQISRRIVTLQGKTVYETRTPILEGQLGTAHLGIWADAVEQEIYQALFMFLWPITLVLLTAVIIAVFLARRLIRPFRRLIDIAGRISTSDLDTPVRVESQAEFGELTRSLERMRASLKATMARLNGDRHTAPKVKDKGGKDELGTG